MKLRFILLALLIFTSCSTYKKVNKTSSGEVEVQEIEVTEEIKEVEVEPVSEDLNLVKVKNFTGFSKQEIGRFWLYANQVDNITLSKCFEDHILNRSKVTRTNGKSRAEVIEDHRKQKPILRFEMYYKNNSTVGYTYPSSDKIWMNRKFHKNYSIGQSAANLAHERSHKIGYGHDFKRTKDRPNQVPYVIGEAILSCWKKLQGTTQQTYRKVKKCYSNWRTLFRERCYFTKVYN